MTTLLNIVVCDRWIRKEDRWYLQHRVYQQMSVNAAFLPDSTMGEEVAKTPHLFWGRASITITI